MVILRKAILKMRSNSMRNLTVLHWSETVQVLDFDEYKERERNDE